jgi:hypothetical protein
MLWRVIKARQPEGEAAHRLALTTMVEACIYAAFG